MKPLAIFAATIVTLALISYSIAILTEQRKKLVINRVLVFLTLGVILDISATIMMIIVSENSPFTIHGILGYSSLTLMLIDAILEPHQLASTSHNFTGSRSNLHIEFL